MTYRVEDRLDLFDFHDTELSLVSFDKNELVISAKHLNIHKDAKENPHECDMEIDFAKLVFAHFEVISFEPMRTYQIDDDGNWYTDEPQIIYNGVEAEKRFLNEIKKSIAINCIDICKKRNKTYIELSTSVQDRFFVTFAFEDVVVEWNEYCKKAWYELHKEYIHKGCLITPDGEVETEIHIVCHEEDMCYQGKLEKGPIVNVGVKYGGVQLWGRGKEYLWEDAFANVQKKLPGGVILKCCMTCRHGNMCPYGNEPGKLYCTKDLKVDSKEGVCRLFDDHETYRIFDKVKSVTDHCDEYRPQSNYHYTYNDYLYHLEK